MMANPPEQNDPRLFRRFFYVLEEIRKSYTKASKFLGKFIPKRVLQRHTSAQSMPITASTLARDMLNLQVSGNFIQCYAQLAK